MASPAVRKGCIHTCKHVVRRNFGLMSQQYGKVDSALVEHHHFRSLSRDAKLICLHLRVTSRNNAIGCFYYPASHLADDLDIPFEDASKALRELSERAFALYCEKTRWVWIPKYLEHFPVKGKNSGKHALSVLQTIPREFEFSAQLIIVFEQNHDWQGDNEEAKLDAEWGDLRTSFEAPLKGLPSRARSTTTTTTASTTATDSTSTSPTATGSSDAKSRQPVMTKREGKSAKTWDAYSVAYANRYGVDPTRNAKTNSLLCQLVDRLGDIEAPHVAGFYLGHSATLYVRSKHCVDLLVRDAEGLRTEWATNTKVTDTKARQADRTQANGEVWNKLISEADHEPGNLESDRSDGGTDGDRSERTGGEGVRDGSRRVSG